MSCGSSPIRVCHADGRMRLVSGGCQVGRECISCSNTAVGDEAEEEEEERWIVSGTARKEEEAEAEGIRGGKGGRGGGGGAWMAAQNSSDAPSDGVHEDDRRVVDEGHAALFSKNASPIPSPPRRAELSGKEEEERQSEANASRRPPPRIDKGPSPLEGSKAYSAQRSNCSRALTEGW